ncbi:hypothetical protein MKQ68_06015 [Chitinophaga horti]|uniref:Uncharacterized protein n=1 Tax=Chitinophaga horti TaxID=2920382 RepID=A0ABY6J8N3_9BACT|nr:hypothetical protein [Chitinophaga horti]UYQ94646.1 hypothetical protein MKQ68_06015 [Chitinophaga horti]
MTSISSGTDTLIFDSNQKGGVDFNAVCRSVAAQLQLPEAFICYMLFDRLYPLGPRQAISFLIDSELVRYLYNNRGKFELEATGDHVTVTFEDGGTLGGEDADLTWEQFFEMGYIDCSREHLTKVNKALSEELLDVVGRLS